METGAEKKGKLVVLILRYSEVHSTENIQFHSKLIVFQISLPYGVNEKNQWTSACASHRWKQDLFYRCLCE